MKIGPKIWPVIGKLLLWLLMLTPFAIGVIILVSRFVLHGEFPINF